MLAFVFKIEPCRKYLLQIDEKPLSYGQYNDVIGNKLGVGYTQTILRQVKFIIL